MAGKVAIIAGSSRGTGTGLVAAYRGLGWAVVAAARTTRPAQEEDLVAVAADTADPATPGRLIGAALDRFGRIDTLVNNASIHLSKPFTDYTAADYAAVSGMNLAGFFWLTQRVIAEMATRYGGHVVSVLASMADIADPGPPGVLAALTRAGQAAATRSLALEYASRGIRVNAVAPGLIETPLYPAGSYRAPGHLPPLGRAGRVSDVVNAVLFLESSPYITGEIVHVDGGLAVGQEGAI